MCKLLWGFLSSNNLKNSVTTVKDIYNKGFFHLFSANSLIHLIEFGSQLFVAWILLADDVGRIKTFQSFSAIAVVIAGVGFNTSILKLCSEKNTTLLEKQTLFFSAVKSTLLFSLLTISLIFFLSTLGYISNDSVTNKLFIYYALSVPLLALNNLLIAYYQALKEFKKVSVLLVFARIIHVAIIISLTYLYGLKGFVVGIVLGYLISTILLLSKIGFVKGWRKTSKIHFKKNWELAKFAFLANTVSMITLYLDIFLLNHLITDIKEFGYYGFALTLIAGLRIITITAQQFVTPYFSEFSSNYHQSMRAFKKANRLFMSFIIIAGLAAVLIVPLFVQFVFSGKYDNSILYFQALTLVWIIRSIPSLKGPFLLSYGYMNVNFYSALIVLAISVFPCWYLISMYSIEGAIWAQVFTAITFFIVVNLNFNRVVKKIKLKNQTIISED